MTFLIETAFEEREPIEDPWGQGMQFWVLPNGHPQVAQASRNRAGGSVARRILRTLKKKLAATHGDARKNLEKQMQELLAGNITDENLPQMIDLLGDDFDEMLERESQAETAAARVERWAGVNGADGKPVELNRENAVALFSLPTVIPPGQPGADHVSVGGALADLVIRESLAAQEARSIGEAQAAKNSPRSGGGGSKSGRASGGKSTAGKRRKK